LSSDGRDPGDDELAGQATAPSVGALTGELIEASGHYGLRAEKLHKADTLLSLSAVRQRAGRDALSPQEAAIRVVREKVDAWPDERGRAILRVALGFDHTTVRGRPNRLGLLAAEVNKTQPEGNKLSGVHLDAHFTERLVPDLALALLGDERSLQTSGRPADELGPSGSRKWLLMGGILALALLGLVVFLVLRNSHPPDEASELVFRPVPERCSIDFCRDEARAVEAQTDGFTPGNFVNVEIFTPSGDNANDLGEIYAYNNQLPVDDNGEFVWRYWWDPGMEIGVYHVRITDEATEESVEEDFEFYEPGG
jgi:hypothetical protein